jgi:hypothetical protein
LVDQVHQLSWTLYDRRYSTALYDTTSGEHRTHFHDAYRGQVDGRGVVVANAWTNIGPQDLVKLYEMMGVAVCAVELSTLLALLIQPRHLPSAEHIRPTPTGNAEFDDRFTSAFAPGVQELLTADVQQRIMAHDDWAFVAADNWMVCASRGAFESADDVSRRFDEVTGIVGAFPAALVPTQIDRSVDDLAARIDKIESVEDALAFLQQLTPDDRQRLAQSNTPLAAFADVQTPEQAMARLESLDVQHRMQLLAMFQRVEDH